MANCEPCITIVTCSLSFRFAILGATEPKGSKQDLKQSFYRRDNTVGLLPEYGIKKVPTLLLVPDKLDPDIAWHIAFSQPP